MAVVDLHQLLPDTAIQVSSSSSISTAAADATTVITTNLRTEIAGETDAGLTQGLIVKTPIGVTGEVKDLRDIVVVAMRTKELTAGTDHFSILIEI